MGTNTSPTPQFRLVVVKRRKKCQPQKRNPTDEGEKLLHHHELAIVLFARFLSFSSGWRYFCDDDSMGQICFGWRWWVQPLIDRKNGPGKCRADHYHVWNVVLLMIRKLFFFFIFDLFSSLRHNSSWTAENFFTENNRAGMFYKPV